MTVFAGEPDHLIVSGRGAVGPAFISFTHSTNGGKTWSQSSAISAITSPGCQAPIAGVGHIPSGMLPSGEPTRKVGAMITSPSGPGRSHLAAYVASAASNFTGVCVSIDWTMLDSADTKLFVSHDASREPTITGANRRLGARWTAQ